MGEKSVCAKWSTQTQMRFPDAFSDFNTTSRNTNEKAIIRNFSTVELKCAAEWKLSTFLQQRKH